MVCQNALCGILAKVNNDIYSFNGVGYITFSPKTVSLRTTALKTNHKENPMRTCLLLLSLLFFLSNVPHYALASGTQEKDEISTALNVLYKDRAQNLLNSALEKRLESYYIPSLNSSKFALGIEVTRAKYLQAWASNRNIKFTDSQSEVHIVRIRLDQDHAHVVLIQRNRLEYIYLNKIIKPQVFGLGTRHVLTLKKINNRWHVLKEWYLDPLDEDPKLVAENIDRFPSPVNEDVTNGSGSRDKSVTYNREKALAYANKYAGLAWGAGNNNRYNRKYRDYTGLGGDCTNFVSQVLGDPQEGGGLPMTKRWFSNPSGGSQAWVSTDGLVDFLLHSGYARLIVKGTFEAVVKPTDKHPHGAIMKLKPGDLIAYEMKGDVDHFSIIVGFDENGYPLVNSHTTDRYRVPFDLGWDKNTKYWLFHVRD
jgi:hypothetical protein